MCARLKGEVIADQSHDKHNNGNQQQAQGFGMFQHAPRPAGAGHGSVSHTKNCSAKERGLHAVRGACKGSAGAVLNYARFPRYGFDP